MDVAQTVEIANSALTINIVESMALREYVNGVWFIFSLELLGLVVWRAIHEWRQIDGRILPHLRKWHSSPVAAAALVIATYLSAEAIMRGWVWYLLKRQNDGLPLSNLWPVPLVAGGLAIAASLCGLRVFVPAPYKSLAMWGGTGIAIGAIAASEIWF